MSKQARMVAVAALVAGLGVLGAAGTASAGPTDPPGHSDYGHHVVDHNDHFGGQHNPGVMHHGYSGWEGHHHD
jgi:hypothetical protein